VILGAYGGHWGGMESDDREVRRLRMRRRSFLRGAAGALGALWLPALGACNPSEDEVPVRAAPPGARWLAQARIAGLDFSSGDPSEFDRALDMAAASGASVIEADAALSDFMTDAAWEEQMSLLDDVAARSHARNLKIVWYYPTLEVVTPEGERPEVPSIYKQHPEWMQTGVGGDVNVFYGQKEHWVPPGAESAWLCHNSGYREYFFARMRRLAATGIDGAWLDVPLYMTTAAQWVCVNPACRDKFERDTGLSAATLHNEDWTTPEWRTWIVWQHEEILRFCQDTVAVAQSVRPDFECIFEFVTMDGDFAGISAQDGSFRELRLSKPRPDAPPAPQGPARVLHVWEVDSISNDFGMRPATFEDWACKLRMFKWAKAADRGGPSWAFSYGSGEDDAAVVMAMCVAAGCSPYETKTPEMVTTVSWDFRTRMFRWIADRSELLLDADRIDEVGLLQSSPSRDWLEEIDEDSLFVHATGLSAELGEVDPSFVVGKSILETAYMAEYLGMSHLLSTKHVPFSIVPMMGLLAEDEAYLRSFKVLFGPMLRSVTDRQLEMLVAFVRGGGTLILTGDDKVGWLDDLGATRAPAARLDRRLGFDSAKVETLVLPVGSGVVYFSRSAVGAPYMKRDERPAVADVVQRATSTLTRRLRTDDAAFRHVHLELTRSGSRYLLQAVNYSGAVDRLILPDGSVAKAKAPAPDGYPFADAFSVAPLDFWVEVTLPGVRAVRASSPDAAFDPTRLTSAPTADGVRLDFRLGSYVLVELDV
jgi:hypothetical protein